MKKTVQPFFDLSRQTRRLALPLDAAWHRVRDSGRLILGEEVASFEKEFARFCHTDYGVGVGSGTEALHVALAACGVGAGDEVITVSQTAVATATAILLTGATPIFCDVEPDTLVMDVHQLDRCRTEKTKAVVPVHLYGRPVDMDPLLNWARKRQIKVIEDSCQAHGALYKKRPVGGLGDAGCFSFYPTKNLGALGDGGIVVTRDSALTDRMRLLRQYGWRDRYISHSFGWNSRLDELQAALLRVKLPYLSKWTEKRRTLAGIYLQELTGCSGIRLLREDPGHVYHLFVVRAKNRESLRADLQEQGIQTLIHYPTPVHRQPAFKVFPKYGLVETEEAEEQILSLPLYPEMTSVQVKRVCRAIRSFYGD